MNDEPPVMKPEHAHAPDQLAPNAPDSEDDLLETMANTIVKSVGVIIGAAVTLSGARLVYRHLTKPSRTRPQQQSPPPRITLLTDEPFGLHPSITAEPQDREAQMAANEWGAADVDLIADRPADLVEAIELLPDAPRPAETPMIVAAGRSPVLHTYRRLAMEQAQRHAREYPRQEVGGILLGVIRQAAEGALLSIVTGIIRADTAIGREASVRFGPDTWVDTLAIRDRHPIYGDEDTWQVVGWYHTHPGFGIFLSSLDVHTHGAFLHPGHIALVIDPSNGQYGTFGWNRDQTQPVRLAEDARAKAWKTLRDEQQMLQLLNGVGLKLTELPPAELTAGPPAPFRLPDKGAPVPRRHNAPAQRDISNPKPDFPQDNGDQNMT